MERIFSVRDALRVSTHLFGTANYYCSILNSHPPAKDPYIVNGWHPNATLYQLSPHRVVLLDQDNAPPIG